MQFWILRIGFAMCFVGHGVFGLLQKPEWVPFFQRFGIEADWAMTLMPIVGGVDIAVGLAGLVLPLRLVFLYGAVWCLFTAALRPLTGLGVAELLERAGNYGVPLALLAMTAGHRWLARIPGRASTPALATVGFRVCQWTTATLLVGHGLLALAGKPLLLRHLSVTGLPADALPLLGALELVLATLCVTRPGVGLFAGVAVWKIASESLFMAAGAPVWEFIERGGSYTAPIVAAMLLGRSAAGAPATGARTLAAATLAGVVILSAGQVGAQRQADPPGLTPSLVEDLRSGGFVVACRHAITDRSRQDQRRLDFDDPSTQRVLSPAGVEQARALGREIAALRIAFDPVLASPFQRTRLSAELMFDDVEIATALSSRERGGPERQRLFTGPVRAGANRLLMTHQGILYSMYPGVRRGAIDEGDCLVVRPGDPDVTIEALVKPGGWQFDW